MYKVWYICELKNQHFLLKFAPTFRFLALPGCSRFSAQLRENIWANISKFQIIYLGKKQCVIWKHQYPSSTWASSNKNLNQKGRLNILLRLHSDQYTLKKYVFLQSYWWGFLLWVWSNFAVVVRQALEMPSTFVSFIFIILNTRTLQEPSFENNNWRWNRKK